MRLGKKMPPAVAAVLRRNVRRLGKSEGFMVGLMGREDSGEDRINAMRMSS
jgi:hypothetical protein